MELINSLITAGAELSNGKRQVPSWYFLYISRALEKLQIPISRYEAFILSERVKGGELSLNLKIVQKKGG